MQVVDLDGGAVVDAVLAVLFLGHAAAAAQDIGQRELIVRQQHFDAAHAVGQHVVEFYQQCGQADTGLGAGQQHIRVERQKVRRIALIVDDQLRDALAVQAAEHFVGDGKLLGGLRIPGVGHLDDDIRKGGFFQRTFERFDQVMRQAADKADRIDQNDLQSAGQRQLAGRGVQRGKQHVGFKDLLAAQRVQQAGLAHVGVAHERDDGHIVFLAGAAGLAPALFHFL